MPSDFATPAEQLYCPRRLKLYVLGAVALVLGYGCLTMSLHIATEWMHGHPPANPEFLAVFIGVPFFIGGGLLLIISAMRGLPRLTVTRGGIKLESVMGTKWAQWNSLSPFLLKTTRVGRLGRKIFSAVAVVTGRNISPNLKDQKILSITDSYEDDIETIIAALNRRRAAALGIAAPAANDEAPEKTVTSARALPDYKRPSLTYGLIAALTVAFFCEVHFGIYDSFQLKPMIPTLLALGGLNRIVMLNTGDIYALFTAPLLHESVMHLVWEGIALYLSARFLEKYVGRLWLFALFAMSAIAGSVWSLFLMPAQTTYVGNSGAVAGLCAAAYILSFRLRDVERKSVQLRILWAAIVALLPIVLTASRHLPVNFAAPLGGGLTGALVGWLLIKTWRTPHVPPLLELARLMTVMGTLAFGSGILAVTVYYPAYRTMAQLIDPIDLPVSEADRIKDSAYLVRIYPHDPRSHLYRGLQLLGASDLGGAQHEFETALDRAHDFRFFFSTAVEFTIRRDLAALLAVENKTDEAKKIAQPVCKSTGKNAAILDALKSMNDLHLCD